MAVAAGLALFLGFLQTGFVVSERDSNPSLSTLTRCEG